MDLILGHFADHYLADMSAQDLSDLDDLLALPDQQVYEWITGKADVPNSYQSSVLQQIQSLDFLDETDLRK